MSAILFDQTLGHNVITSSLPIKAAPFCKQTKCTLIRQDKVKSGPSAKYSSDTQLRAKSNLTNGGIGLNDISSEGHSSLHAGLAKPNKRGDMTNMFTRPGIFIRSPAG